MDRMEDNWIGGVLGIGGLEKVVIAGQREECNRSEGRATGQGRVGAEHRRLVSNNKTDNWRGSEKSVTE